MLHGFCRRDRVSRASQCPEHELSWPTGRKFDCWNDYRNWPGNPVPPWHQMQLRPVVTRLGCRSSGPRLLHGWSCSPYCQQEHKPHASCCGWWSRSRKPTGSIQFWLASFRQESSWMNFEITFSDKQEEVKNVLSGCYRFWLGYSRLWGSPVSGSGRTDRDQWCSPALLFDGGLLTPKLLYSVKRSHLRGF